MNIKMMSVALFVVVAMSFGLFASMPVVESFLPWVGMFAVVSAFWPIVAMVLGAFGVLAFSNEGKAQMEFDLNKPGHKAGYLTYIFLGRTIRAARQMGAAGLEKAGKWVEPKQASKKVKVVSPLFRD
jgi:hypothetical protein